jgi:PAS domain S-box-containing protein
MMFKVLLCVATEHNWWLVGLAAMVCLPATLATFFLYSKVPAFPLWRRWAWLGMTGLVAGSGIWTTHFVAMLAFKTGLPTGYAALPTIASLLVAVASTGLGFAIGSRPTSPARQDLRALVGGMIVGLGITLMHYVGMGGYRTAGVVQWDPAYVIGSVVVGALFASAALGVAKPGSGFRRQMAGGALLSLGIVGMHFTGMTAVTILPDPTILVPPTHMSGGTMATAAVAVAVLILVTATGGVAFDAASRDWNLRRLQEALDVMPEGLAFYDSSDRLVAWNAQYERLCGDSGALLVVGMAYDELLDSNLVHGVYPEAAGREAAWLAQRQAARQGLLPNLTEQTASGRWLRITERRTGDGGTVSVSVDITDLKRTEVAMAEARDKAEELARWADMAESIAGLGHWRMDAKTQDLTWSTQMYRIYGLELDAPLDFPALMAMTHPEDAAASAASMERRLGAGEADENSITRIVRASGEVRFLAGVTRVERGPGGEVIAVMGTIVDVTDQKVAEAAVAASEERFRRLADNAPDIIAECRLDGVMTYVSPASLAITGFLPEELVGRTFASLMEPEDSQRVQAMCQAVFASKGKVSPWPVEFRARHKTGAEIWLECKPTLAVDPATGLYTGLTDVIRDITLRKALEAQLRLAQAEAEAAAAVKSEFLANMSHELRTPLTSIIGFTSLAAEQPGLAELTRTYVERVGDASRALLCTVNDILDFSKLEAGQVSIQPQPVSLAKLGRGTLDLFTPQAGAKDLNLMLDSDAADQDLVVAIDPDRIRQILLNLVSNAVKFTKAGAVTLRIRYDYGDETLRVEVIDTGAGIPEDKQHSLFKRFSQIDGSLTRSQSGTGLGLAICKGLVEAMGGRIGMDSEIGHGSRFWFEIPAPLASLSVTRDMDPGIARPTFEGIRVLVVDDHATNRELARLFLAGVGIEVTEADSGEDAAQLAADWPFDAILMDLRMPGLDGLGALQRIRAAAGPNDATPILAFTADADAALTAHLLAMGFQDVVPKPLEPEVLITSIARATAFAQAPQIQEFADAG